VEQPFHQVVTSPALYSHMRHKDLVCVLNLAMRWDEIRYRVRRGMM